MSKKIRNSLFLLLTSIAFFFAGNVALAQSVPTGRPITLQEILLLMEDIAGFLLLAGTILAGITIILSGISYLTAGGDATKTQKAKGILKAGLIGAVIIFGFGIIINTVSNFATDPLQFFGGGGGGGSQTYCNGGIRAGQVCTTGTDCPNNAPGTCGGQGQVLCSYSLCI